jgi:hypothetical protein
MARLAEQRQGQQMMQGALQGQLGVQQAQQQGMMGYEGARTNRYNSSLGIPTQSQNVYNMAKDGLSFLV